MFDRGYLRAPWTDFDVIWFKMTAQTSSFQRYQIYAKLIARKIYRAKSFVDPPSWSYFNNPVHVSFCHKSGLKLRGVWLHRWDTSTGRLLLIFGVHRHRVFGWEGKKIIIKKFETFFTEKYFWSREYFYFFRELLRIFSNLIKGL